MGDTMRLAVGIMGTSYLLFVYYKILTKEKNLQEILLNSHLQNITNLAWLLISGNATSLLLYAAPIFTFRRVIRKRSTEEFSCVPYILALMNCLFYTWYGLPIVSHKWENFPVVTINGIGVFLECSFILIYFWFASSKGKKKVALMTIPVITLFVITAMVSTFAFHTHRQRKILVGSVGLVASIAMYSSPLVVVKQVIQTKSVEFMPFYLSFFCLLASALWMLYGLMGHDLFLASPNIVGCPLCIFQLLLYCIYRKKKKAVTEEPIQAADLEKNEENFKVQQLIISYPNEKC